MKLSQGNYTKLLAILISVILITGGATSCKSKKKLAREKAAAEYAAKVEQAKKDLTAIINGTTSWTIDQQSDKVNQIKSYNIDDSEVIEMIKKAEAKIALDIAESERLAEEERLKLLEEEKRKKEASKYTEIDKQLKSFHLIKVIDRFDGLIQKAAAGHIWKL